MSRALNGRAESSANGRTPNGDLGASPLSPREKSISYQVLKEIAARLQFMVNVGLDYLTLSRARPRALWR